MQVGDFLGALAALGVFQVPFDSVKIDREDDMLHLLGAQAHMTYVVLDGLVSPLQPSVLIDTAST